MALYNITSTQEFETHVLKNDKIVLVDLWAKWCAPCRMMEPILESVAKKMENDIDVAKIDIEATSDNGALAQKYGVQSIPNMKVFKNGEVVDELIGMRPEVALIDELKAHLK